MLLALSFEYVNSYNVTNFDSAGVYFQHKGKLLVENDVFWKTTFIDLEPYHKAIELIKNTSLSYRTKCVKLSLNCDREFNEITVSHDDLVKRLNNVYLILLERPVQRKKRFLGIITGVIGIAFGIGNTIQASNLAKDVESMRNYMKDNFNDLKSLLESQGKAQVELKKQQNFLSGVLDVHEKKIYEVLERIHKLEQTTSELRAEVNVIKMRVIFQDIKIDILEILGKLRELEQWMLDLKKNILHAEIMTPENITDAMNKHKLKTGSRFLAEPTLSNYAHITETIAGSAFIVRELKTIFVNLRIPIYQEQQLNLFQVLEVPFIKNRKAIRIANNRNHYCVISEDTDQYDCINGNHKFTKGKHFYFSVDSTDVSLLPTSKSRLCIMNIFTQKSLEGCRYKAVSPNIEIIKKIDTHKYLFALRDKTKFYLECNRVLEDGRNIHTDNLNKDEYLQSTGIMYLQPGCRFNTEHFESDFKTSNAIVNTWNEYDVYDFSDLQEDLDEQMTRLRSKSRQLESDDKMVINFEDMYQL